MSDLSDRVAPDRTTQQHPDNSQPVNNPPSLSLQFRTPRAEDGPEVSALIQRCPPLDNNSRYCNLLQCSHFAPTCVLVESNGKVVGFVSGYLIPDRPDTLFIWQIAVDESMRGQKLAARMVNHILQREPLRSVRYIETTITPANLASQAVFLRLAESLSAELARSVLFARDTHFAGLHDDEVLFRIGPFSNSQTKS